MVRLPSHSLFRLPGPPRARNVQAGATKSKSQQPARTQRLGETAAQEAANARPVRARNVRAARQAAHHPAPPSPAAGTAPTIRSIVVRALPVSRPTSALLRPPSTPAPLAP